MMTPLWKVSYIHTYTSGAPYRVSRTFTSHESAQEFIDVNAAVCPLPGVKLIEPGEVWCGCWNFERLGHCIHTA